jgi:hypothetical protein
MIHKLSIIDRILYGIVVWCIFSFRVILIHTAGSGLRIDDVLILIAFLLLLFRGDLRRTTRPLPFNIYLGFVAISVISVAWNAAMGRVDPFISCLFVARLLQYMVFYYLGYRIAKNGIRITRLLSYYLAFLCAIVPLQMLGLLPVLGSFGDITSRAVGNTNGPYELAAVGAFLLCYLGYSSPKKTKGVFSILLVLLSASRITFIATALSVAKVILWKSRSRAILILRVVGLGLVGCVAFLVLHSTSSNLPGTQDGVIGRLTTAASTGISLNTLGAAYGAAAVYHNSTDYSQGAFSDADAEANQGGGDVSGLTRVFRWTSLIKSTLNGLDTILIGLGPSFGSIAVDGYFVRVFVETGVLGLLVFCWFAKSVLAWGKTYSWTFREYVLILLVTGCFIDIFVSYKPMLLFWLWLGMQQFNSKRKLHGSTAQCVTRLKPDTRSAAEST